MPVVGGLVVWLFLQQLCCFQLINTLFNAALHFVQMLLCYLKTFYPLLELKLAHTAKEIIMETLIILFLFIAQDKKGNAFYSYYLFLSTILGALK